MLKLILNIITHFVSIKWEQFGQITSVGQNNVSIKARRDILINALLLSLQTYQHQRHKASIYGNEYSAPANNKLRCQCCDKEHELCERCKKSVTLKQNEEMEK